MLEKNISDSLEHKLKQLKYELRNWKFRSAFLLLDDDFLNIPELTGKLDIIQILSLLYGNMACPHVGLGYEGEVLDFIVFSLVDLDFKSSIPKVESRVIKKAISFKRFKRLMEFEDILQREKSMTYSTLKALSFVYGDYRDNRSLKDRLVDYIVNLFEE